MDKKVIKKSELSKKDFIKLFLTGEIKTDDIKEQLKKYSFPSIPFAVLLINSKSGKINEVVQIVENYSDKSPDFVVPICDTECVLIKFSDKSSEDYRSFSEYADFLSQSIYDELGKNIDIYIGGTVDSLDKLLESYFQAVDTLRMSEKYMIKGNVHSYKEFILIKTLEGLDKESLKGYFFVLADEKTVKLFKDDEMITTAEEFLNNNLNISETARKLFLHRNTLTYRLEKIERITGLDIRKFSDAVSFRMILLLLKIL